MIYLASLKNYPNSARYSNYMFGSDKPLNIPTNNKEKNQ